MRTVPTELTNAINHANSYYFLIKAEAWKSRVFFNTITSDYAIAGADSIGMNNNPLKQDIEYNAAQGLVTFWSNGTKLCYAVQGSTTVTTTAVDCSVKPGILGDVIYCYSGSTITRYGITWSNMSFASEATITETLTVVALHALSATEVASICNDDGGFRCHYISGTTIYESDGRFMFPSFADWDESSRTMVDLGLFSCSMLLSNTVGFYISNASSGMVEGMIYDKGTGKWSSSFIVIPSDLETSLCELRISNGFVRNSTFYMCGHFRRTDSYTGDQPYTLLMKSSDGKHFSIDRFTLVSNIGYRFLARVGSNNNLYLANSNRVCYTPVTWIFDGTGTNGPKTEIAGTNIIGFSDDSLSSATIVLKASDEVYMTDTNITEGTRMIVYTGMKTTATPSEQYVVYGTYIVESIDEGYADGERTLSLSLINESQWKLSGLNMPFYAEILGKSTLYEPMVEISGKMHPATNASLTQTYFDIDFWSQEPYTNTGQSITGISMIDGGGVRWKDYETTFKYGIITSEEIKTILNLRKNPIITASPLAINIHGWARTHATGQNNPIVEAVVILCDENGDNEETIITNDDTLWKQTYYDTVAGEEPIAISWDVSTHVGKYIKKVGIVFEQGQTYGNVINIARVEFTNNVRVMIIPPGENSMWEKQGDGTWLIPGPGRPHLMLGQKPYNAYNLKLMARYTNTVTGNITGYAVGGGVVCHCEDGSNYTAGRYNATNSKVELVVCRNGIETVLGNATPGWTVGSDQRILLTHQDGKFDISMYRTSTDKYESVLSYEWQAANGFMYTSRTSPMKSGIYGFIGAPWFKTLGLWKSDSDSANTSEGIGINPLDSIAGFTEPGSIKLDNNTYSYTSTVAKPSIVRGPYQFRQMDKYDEPYGTGGHGLEVYDFDWNAATNSIDNYLIAVDSGAVFLADDSLWRVWITTGGQTVWLYGRARYYSANSSIGKIYHTLNNKVWVTGGLKTLTLTDGTTLRHPERSIAYLKLDGTITCSYFMGSSGEEDFTLTDLISSVCQFAGAQVSFIGDTSTSSLVIGTSTLIQRDYYADGFSFSWETAAPESFTIETNIKIVPDNYEEKTTIENDTGIDVAITSLGSGNYKLGILSTPSDTMMYQIDYTSGTGAQKYKLTFHSKNISYYQDGQWIATFTFDNLNYAQAEYVDVKATASSVTFTNILYRELSDMREAIYIDMETDGISAINSIIQERPIETGANPDGSISMWYQKPSTEITGTVQARAIKVHRQVPKDGSSDAIIYASKDVVTIQHSGFGKDLGFGTRLIKLPNMEAGAIEAARVMLNKLYNKRKQTIMDIRPDLRVTPADLYTYSYTLSGTGTVISGTLYIEGVSLRVDPQGSSSMNIKGRLND